MRIKGLQLTTDSWAFLSSVAFRRLEAVPQRRRSALSVAAEARSVRYSLRSQPFIAKNFCPTKSWSCSSIPWMAWSSFRIFVAFADAIVNPNGESR